MKLLGLLQKWRALGRQGFTFLLVPHRAGALRTFQFHLSARWFYALAGLSVFSLLFLIGAFVYSMRVSGELEHYRLLKREASQQKVKLEELTREATELEQSIEELNNRDYQLRKHLGLSSRALPARDGHATTLVAVQEGQSVDALLKELSDLTERAKKREKSYQHLLSRVLTLKQKMAALPSGWPTYGRISSRFGYRSVPWQGFHSGLDISTDYGAPIYATAGGVVAWVGWETGYGRTVVLRHELGFATRYGHCSKLAVQSGQRVSRGDVVAYVGTTGYSTGAHVHYEVMRYGQHLDPTAFLYMDLPTASRILGEGAGAL